MNLNLPWTQFAFYLVFVITVMAGLYAVSKKNLVHAALCLVVVFCGIAAAFVLLRADFLAAVQLLVYVGAVSVLILFAIMLTRDIKGEQDAPMAGAWFWGVSLSGLILVVLSVAIFSEPAGLESAPALDLAGRQVDSPVKQLGMLMVQDYVVPFEVAAILLTAALVGAIVIALNDSETEKTNPDTIRQQR